jgi:hypothetical protein
MKLIPVSLHHFIFLTHNSFLPLQLHGPSPFPHVPLTVRHTVALISLLMKQVSYHCRSKHIVTSQTRQAVSANNCCFGKGEVLHIGLHVHNCACVRADACGYQGAWACIYVHIALLIQHRTRILHSLRTFVAPRSPPHFSTLSHKRRDFLKNVTQHKMCVLIFSTIFV